MISVFLCHSGKDKVFAGKLAKRLRDYGVDVLIDEAELKEGDSLIDKIPQTIENDGHIVIVLSRNSIYSQWLQKDLQTVLSQDNYDSGGIWSSILPIILEECEIPTFLKTKSYANFTSPANFEISFLGLLNAIGISKPIFIKPDQQLSLKKTDISEKKLSSGKTAITAFIVFTGIILISFYLSRKGNKGEVNERKYFNKSSYVNETGDKVEKPIDKVSTKFSSSNDTKDKLLVKKRAVKNSGRQEKELERKISTRNGVENISMENKIYRGWFYLGRFERNRNRWKNKTVKGYDGRIPQSGEEVTLKISVYLRDDRPRFPENKKGKLVPPNTVPVGAALTIKNIDSEVGFNHVWAEVVFSAGKIAELTEKAKRNDSDLLAAVKQGNMADMLKILIKTPDIDARYKDGMTPLILAAKKGYTEIVGILTDKGADVNAIANDGWTALMTAAWKGRSGIVQLLLEKGASVNKESNNGWTALLVASKYGHIDIVKSLLAQGGSVLAKNRKGISALKIATMRNHADIVQTLKQAGAAE